MIFLKGKSECYVMFFYRLLILCLPLGTKPTKKCFERKKSDLFDGGILILCNAEITNRKYNKGGGEESLCKSRHFSVFGIKPEL